MGLDSPGPSTCCFLGKENFMYLGDLQPLLPRSNSELLDVVKSIFPY